MDILYVIGKGSKRDNIELRWSLRSLEKWGKNVGRIIVAGHIPDFLNDKAVKVPFDQKRWLNSKNIGDTIFAAIDSGAIKRDFLLSADDHFYTKEVDFDKYPVYRCGELPYLITPECPNKEYFAGLVGSRWLLTLEGLPTYNTSNHNCVPVSLSSLRRHPRIVKACKDVEYRMNMWALLGNMNAGEYPDIAPTNRRDIKITKAITCAEELAGIIGEEHVFSVGDQVFQNEIFCGIMNSLYPNKSRWEK